MTLTSVRTSESHLFEGMVIGDEAAVFADGAYAKDAGKNMSSFTRKRIWEKPLDTIQKWP